MTGKPANSGRKTALALSVQYACDDAGAEAQPTRAQLRRRVLAALAPRGIRNAEITLRFVGTEEGRMLNRDYRDKDYATNVLTFPYSPAPRLAGDLVLCTPVVLDEARRQGKTAAAHFAHLVVHGILHLQGYDHETDGDARRMEAKECEILRRFGIADPYEDAAQR